MILKLLMYLMFCVLFTEIFKAGIDAKDSDSPLQKLKILRKQIPKTSRTPQRILRQLSV